MNYNKAKVAADWWIEEMKKKCRQSYPNKLTENNSNLEIIDDSLAEEFSRFHTVLINEILNLLSNNYSITLTCYYIPNSLLKNIAKKAQISTTYFPYSAEMHIYNNSIQVSTTGESLRELSLPD